MRTKLLLFAFAPALCLGQDQFQKIRETIPARLTETKTPSLAIAVARDGKIIWEEGFGLADRENGVAASADLLYPVASLSKPFTATAIMVLVERGVVKLDVPGNQYLGEAKLHARVGNAGDATVRRLANHTSGLPSHYQLFSRHQPLRPPSMDETIRRFGNLVTPPGEQYEYSNLGYGILGYIIERVAHRSYMDFVQESVLAPLGVRHSEPSSRAVRYDNTGTPLPEFDTDHPGAAAIFASAHDLALFGLFQLGELPLKRPILTEASLDLMHTPMVETGPSQGYGLGWEVQTNAGYRTIFHKGGMAGATSSLHLIPEHHLVVAAVANSASPLPDEIRKKIIALMVPLIEVSPAGRRPQPQPAPQGEWSGKIATYRSDLPLRVKSDGEGVQVALGDAAFGPAGKRPLARRSTAGTYERRPAPPRSRPLRLLHTSGLEDAWKRSYRIGNGFLCSHLHERFWRYAVGRTSPRQQGAETEFEVSSKGVPLQQFCEFVPRKSRSIYQNQVMYPGATRKLTHYRWVVSIWQAH